VGVQWISFLSALSQTAGPARQRRRRRITQPQKDAIFYLSSIRLFLSYIYIFLSLSSSLALFSSHSTLLLLLLLL
jgi:hypothetical protein